MFKEQRKTMILDALQEAGAMTIDDLTKVINVSRSTVCRDITDMEEEGVLVRVHGGVMIPHVKSEQKEPPFDIRSRTNILEKQRIAKSAVKMIKPHNSVLLSRGTSVLEIAKLMQSSKDIQVATYDLFCAMELTKAPDLSFVMLGGTVQYDTYAASGYFAENMLMQTRADIAFIGMDAVDADRGIMDYSTYEIQIKKLMISNSDVTVAICDHTKFEAKAFVEICQFSDIDVLITGKEADSVKINAIESKGVKVVTV